MKRHLALSAALILASLTASCGLKGGLERPAPLWGEKTKAEYKAQKAAEAAAKGEKKNRASVSIPVEGATPAPAATTPEDMTVTTDKKTDAEDAGVPSPDDPYDGKGAPPPVDDNTGSQPKTQF